MTQTNVPNDSPELPLMVDPAAGFEQVSITGAAGALRAIRDNLPAILRKAAALVESGELPLFGWGLSRPRVQVLEHAESEKPWFFVGDLHGDFLAWHTLYQRIRSEPDFRLCFLGDLVDRGPLHLECFALMLEAVVEHPGQILWILGNHDEGVVYRPQSVPRFTASVRPAEFPDWLNGDSTDMPGDQRELWGRLFVDVCARLPRAVLFADGLLATHGGVPLEDRWPTLKNLEAFHHPRTLADFTWTRAADDVPLRRGWKLDPARRAMSSAFDFGYRDLEGFARAAADVLPVHRVVRGHDHVAGGAERPQGYDAVPVLTINGFGFNYINNSVFNYRSDLVVGVHVPHSLPRVENVSIPDGAHLAVYGLRPNGALS